MKADYARAIVNFKQVGPNTSGVNGSRTKINEDHILKNSDKIELLSGKYIYEINFEPKPIYLDNGSIDIEHNGKSPEPKAANNNPKRKRSVEEMDSVSKKSKSNNLNMSNNNINDNINSTLEIAQDCWESISDGKLLIFTKSGVTASSKVILHLFISRP